MQSANLICGELHSSQDLHLLPQLFPPGRVDKLAVQL
jgi:hypothetical protein